MVKFVDTLVSFQEVPDEITLCINISNCPCHCEGCHSAYLAEDIGNPLGYWTLNNLIKTNKGITCVCFMGGDAAPDEIQNLSKWIKDEYPHLKTAWYSGRESIPDGFDLKCLDYIKLGPYIESLGGLKSPATNQALYSVRPDGSLEKISII